LSVSLIPSKRKMSSDKIILPKEKVINNTNNS